MIIDEAGMVWDNVALRKESVDRNRFIHNAKINKHDVALRKESVDRNIDTSKDIIKTARSLSARRAWIEISTYVIRLPRCQVALRKESVDRNAKICGSNQAIIVALRKESVDRNLSMLLLRCRALVVALRKESVDRNVSVAIIIYLSLRRSPQGERG